MINRDVVYTDVPVQEPSHVNVEIEPVNGEVEPGVRQEVEMPYLKTGLGKNRKGKFGRLNLDPGFLTNKGGQFPSYKIGIHGLDDDERGCSQKDKQAGKPI
jgi:hypothetical protein